MKKNIFYSLLLACVAMSFSACSEDELSSESVITSDSGNNSTKTDFDEWLTVNYLQPYNIEIKYRYEYNETDKDFYTVPADYNQSVELAHIVKYTCVEAYNEVGGVEFTRRYFPKMFFLIGEFEYKNNGTMILGTAESGKKILLTGVNKLDQYKNNLNYLNELYLKTIHHEFTHILNQTKDYSSAFQLVTSTGYVADSWSVPEYASGYLQRGFISAYSQHSHGEDFAEMLSMYITNTPEQWEAWMEEAAGTPDDPKTGRELIEAKLNMVRSYMKNSWNIDIDKLRTSVLRREYDVVADKINLSDLTIK